MIAFNRELLENTFLVDSAEDLHDAKFISKDQLKAAKEKFPTLKTHNNLFIRIAFFLLGCFCYSSASGTVALVCSPLMDQYQIVLFLLAALGIFATEGLALHNYYAHGLDDAAILGMQICLVGAFGATFESVPVALAVAIVISAACAIRYLHTISVVICIGSIVGLIVNLVIEYHVIPELYLTFVLFILAIALFVAHRKLSKTDHARFYVNPLRAMQLCSLLVGYFSVNYLVVRELAQDLIQIEVAEGKDIPLAFVFYFLTFAIPIAYMIYSIKEKNRLMLWTGLFTLGFSIFTIRYYYHIMPPEWALLMGGIVLAVVSLALIRKLKHRETGITFEKDRMHPSQALSLAQTVIVNSHAIPNVPSKDPMEFGGGGFSGGGAGENY